MDNDKYRGLQLVVGLGIIGCLVTGVTGIYMASMTESSVGLIGSAIAFGLLVNIIHK